MSLTLNRFCNLGFSFSKQAPTSAQWFHFSGLDSAKRSTKTDLEKRAPPKGYRPPTPYSLFTKEVYKPGMSIAEVGKAAGNLWKTLSPEKLQTYKVQAEKIGSERKAQFDKLSEDEKLMLYAKSSAQRKIRKIRAELEDHQVA